MSTISETAVPALARGVRLHTDAATGEPVLLFPEGVLFLNATAHEVVRRCDGSATVGGIVSALAEEYRNRARRAAPRRVGVPLPASAAPLAILPSVKFRPFLLLAELTHQCPLHCPYCSNPSVYPGGGELATADWQRVLREAAELGAFHVGFSGGEPLLRADLAELVRTARAVGLYTNLITSGIGLRADRVAELRAAGLDAVQLSFQADEAPLADHIAGARAHERNSRRRGSSPTWAWP